MKFGVIVSRNLIDRSSSDPYAPLYRYLNEMEDLGYELGWCGHHRFAPTTAFGGDEATEPSAPLAMLAPLMSRTHAMKFCTNIMLVPSRHPLELAEEINTINEMSNNRFILGAGIGYKPDEFENCGWGFKNRAARFEECLKILPRAMSGERFSHQGQHFQISDVAIQPPPLRGQVPPIWIGAVSDPAMRRAGRLADGWLASFAEHAVELSEKIKVYKDIAASHQRPATVALMRDVHIAETRDRIDPDFLPNIVRTWQSYASLGSHADRDELASSVMFGDKETTLEEFAPNRAVAGTPDDCIAELARIRELINPEWLLITPTGIPDPQQRVDELRLFAKEVMPLFRTD